MAPAARLEKKSNHSKFALVESAVGSCDDLRVRACASNRENVCSPPLLFPNTTPTVRRARSVVDKPASWRDSLAVVLASSTSGSGWRKGRSVGKMTGAPAIRVGSVQWGAVNQRTALFPATIFCQVDSRSGPCGVHRPIPVMTIRFDSGAAITQQVHTRRPERQTA